MMLILNKYIAEHPNLLVIFIFKNFFNKSLVNIAWVLCFWIIILQSLLYKAHPLNKLIMPNLSNDCQILIRAFTEKIAYLEICKRDYSVWCILCEGQKLVILSRGPGSEQTPPQCVLHFCDWFKYFICQFWWHVILMVSVNKFISSFHLFYAVISIQYDRMKCYYSFLTIYYIQFVLIP